jgi:hypothetical protein
MRSIPDFQNLMNFFSNTGAYSPAVALILLTLMVFAGWKIPGIAGTASLRKAGASLGVHFACAGLSVWLATWEAAAKGFLGFLAMLQLWSFGSAIFFFVASFAAARKNL